MEIFPSIPFQQPTLSESLAGLSPGTGFSPEDARTQEKQASVAAATEAKQQAFGGTDGDMRLLATAIQEGHPMADDPMIQDIARYGESVIAAKYGSQGVDLQRRLNQHIIDARAAENASRNPNQQLGDAARGVAAGAIGGLGGIAAFGTGLVSDSGGAAVADATNLLAGEIREGQSQPLKDQREQAGYRGELDRRDIAQQYEQDQADGVSLPGLRRFGREVLSGGKDLIEHPALAADITAEGIGSLAGSLGVNGVITKGAAKVILADRGITGVRATRFLASGSGKEFLNRVATRNMPISIGLLEGGGAYAGIQAEIQAMSETELMEGSAEYVDLRKQGFTHEAARDRIASIAAQEGGAIQGLIGAATGKLVAKFETDPLGLRSKGAGSFTGALRDVGENALKEGVEESLQGASGNIVAGHAIQRHADASRDPSEGAGVDAVQGAVAGVGMAGVLRAPHLAVGAGVSSVVATGSVVGNAVNKRLQGIQGGVDQESPVGQQAAEEASAQIGTSFANLNAALDTPQTAADNQEISQESSDQIPVVREQFERAVNLGGAEINEAPDAVKRALTDGENVPDDTQVLRADVLTGVLEKLEKKEVPEEDQIAVALWLQDQAQLFGGLENQTLSEFGPEAQQASQEIRDAVNTILENKTLIDMLERSRSATSEDLGPLPEITDQNVDTPEIQQAVNQTVSLARANPAGVDPKFINQLLDQRAAGRLQGLSPRLVTRLKNAAALAEEAAAASKDKAGIEAIGKTQDIVRSEILSEGKNEERNQWGLTRYLSEIETALDEGRTSEAQDFLNNLRNFGQHMHNKVDAATKSAKLRLRNRNSVPYRTWTGSKWLAAEHPNAGGIGISPFHPGSLSLGRAAVVDARLVTNLYNNLLSAYGGTISGSPLKPVRVVSILRPTSKGVVPIKQAKDPAKASDEAVLSEGRSEEKKPAPQAEVSTTIDAPEGKATEALPKAAEEETPTRDSEGRTDAQKEAGNYKMDHVLWNGLDISIENKAGTERSGTDSDGETWSVTMPADYGYIKRTEGADGDHVDVYLADQLDSDFVLIVNQIDPNAGKFDEHKIVLGTSSESAALALYRKGFSDGRADDRIGSFTTTTVAGLKTWLKEEDTTKPVDEITTTEGETDESNEGEAKTADSETSTQPAIGEQGSQEASQEASQDQAEPAPAEGSEPDAVSEVDQGTATELDPGVDADGGVTTELDFSNLVSSKDGLQRFTRAYKINPEKSPLMVEENPARHVVDALRNVGRAKLTTGYEVSATKAGQVADLVETAATKIVKGMNARLTEKAKTLSVGTVKGGDKRELTPLEAIAADATKDYPSFKEARALNIVDSVAGKYDPRLIQTASLAALHWVMNSPQNENLDVEDVAKFFGVGDADVTLDMLQAANWGVRGVTAVESLARVILEFWGTEIQSNAPMSDSLGISQAVSAELLEVMEGHLITTQEFQIQGLDATGKEISKKAVSVRLSHPDTSDQISNIGGMKRVLTDAFLPQSEKGYYFDETPENVRQTQKGNPQGRLGNRMKDALRNHQAIPFYRNTGYVGLMQALGQETYARLMGARDIDADIVNKVDALSIEGRNTQLLNSWKGVVDHNEHLEAHAAANGKLPEDVATHFDWYVVSNERIHADGFNPQSNKTMREAFAATVSDLDLTTTEGRDVFWITVAQSIGVKTEKGTRNANIEKAQELVGEQYQGSVTALEAWLETGELSPEQVETLQEEMADEGPSPKLLHALMSVAQFGQAIAEGGDAAQGFRHNLSLEADGKTDGPINAMVHFISGKFSEDQLSNMAKGGLFLGSGRRTLNEHYQGDPADLYETAAGLMSNLMAKVVRGVYRDPTARPQAQALTELMNNLLGAKDFQINWKTGEIAIGRGTLKNPLTITVYGSGQRGIAGKVANSLMEVVYARLTHAASEGGPGIDPSTEALLRSVTTQRAYYNTRDKEWQLSRTIGRGHLKKTAPLGNVKDVQGFEFSPGNREMLLENLLTFFVEPMSEAIDTMMSTTKETLSDFQAASQVQSAALVERFRNTVQERVTEKREAGELGPQEFLSQSDYNAIFKELSKYGAIIEGVDNDAHHLNLSNRKSAPSRESFARSLSGRFGGQSSLGEPTDAGVSASPMMTISRGDAAMMVNFFAAQEISNADRSRTLPVFDGLEMPADGINTISEKINQAVADAWLENPAQDVADSFSDWVRQGEKGPLEGLSEAETVTKISRALGVPLEEEKLPSVQELESGVIELRDRLQETARSIQARKNVFKRVGLSVDHMASGESPYTQEGALPEGDPVEFLNKLYDEELAKLEEAAETKTAQAVIEQPSEELQGRIEALGTSLWDGIFQLNSKNVVELLSGPGVSADIRRVTAVLARSVPDFKFFFGSSEALTTLRNELTPEHQDAGPIALGQTDPVGGASYISNASGETVLHELLHAATARRVQQFYAAPDALAAGQKDALTNLERLMTQFLDMDFSQESLAVAQTAEILAKQIRQALDQTNEVGQVQALSEFISWTLSNQNLADTLKKSRVRTPLKKLAAQAINFIRRLFGLGSSQPVDMFSNIALNVNVLVEGINKNLPADQAGPVSSLLNQVVGTASDPRLDRLMQEFDQKIAAHLRTRRPAARVTEEVEIAAIADAALNLITAEGFTLDAQQQSAFRAIQAALASSMQLDSRALIRVQKLFTHVLGQLDLANFNSLMDRFGSQKDAQGRSTLMASFLALSQVDPAFREVLANTRLPKDREQSWDSVDAALTSMAEGLMNNLATTISGEGHGNKTALQSLDRLTEVLAKIELDDRTFVEKEANRILGVGDKVGSKYLSKVGERLVDLSDNVTLEANATLRENTRALLLKSAGLVGGLLTENSGKKVSEALVSSGNSLRGKPWIPVLELMNEVFGVTDGNRGIYDLINRVKYAVSGMRQDHRETLPKILAEQFSRKLSKKEWDQLHLGLGKTDIAALGDRFSAERIREILSDKKALAEEISGAEELLKSTATPVSRDYMRKAEELAEFMVSGRIDPANHNLLRNAEAIARLLGERRHNQAVVTDQTIQVIDELTTLYAVRKLDPESLALMVELSDNEKRGMDFLTYHLADLQRQERAKHSSNVTSRLNSYKGYIPSEARSGAKLIVAEDREHNKLVTLGYTRLGTYRGSGTEGGRRSYYFSTVSGRNSYQQGVLQTVQTTSFGVDPRTGYTVSGVTAGRIPNQLVGITRQRLAAQATQRSPRSAGEALMPVYDELGEVVAYERSLAPERLAALDRNTHLGEMIGAWAGRQAEEELAQGFNRLLVDRVWDGWEKGRSEGRSDEYVDLSDENLDDPIQREAWKLIPQEMRDYIKGKFGDNGFMVRRDQVNNTMGYRSASVADAWTGLSRLDKKTQKAFTDTMTVIMGKNAFPWLVRAEKFWQAGISVAKNTIVIRSIVVPASNLASNFIQLGSRGVGPRDIAKGFTTKLVEIDQHLKNLQRKVEIKALRARHHKEPAQLRKLAAEEKLLDDASRRLSIWPLIEAGEFSTISEGLTEADAAIGQGRLAEWLQNQVEKVPSQLGTFGRYAVITRDTALFKGMSRATQYGDFLAKAVLYEHLTKRKGETPKKALEQVSEEFVNYNLLPGRVRSYAESMGLTWFWAYKLRSIKVAHRTIRDHPLRALLATLGGSQLPNLPGVSIGSPITDNFLAKAADGGLSYSTGPGMLFSAPSLNPWVNIVH